jgi:plastocyanin
MHTIVADDGSFSSSYLTAGQTYSYTFTKAGTYIYHCGIHKTMAGTIIVK